MRLEDQLVAAAMCVAPQFRHLLLEIALEMGERHPNVPVQAAPLLRLVQN